MIGKTDAEKFAPFKADLVKAFDESGLVSIAGFDYAVFAAQGFRESGFTWAPGYVPHGDPHGTGDAGHGHGLYQIDDRTYSDWIKLNLWGVPFENMRKALNILRGDKLYFKSLATMPGVSHEMFLRCVLAAFNCGPAGAYKGLLMFNDPDHRTAGADYSAWILAKAADLRVQMPELKGKP